ncbi:GDSL-type esterase/lipase family protein [Novosphingobium mangrovi (ex Huang et al. 2023)]|uniref:GDSL-type esterase/lipase family protein n=1 Tax=Novosphingobium mangrovi (ex Huang et al. 2023) TaxID=2976432 RepID=A0ABT2I347_9SPHN|nr:GDSL-type esterase/lipase family protein [Novosphingobium mangrovi (ex Huang et al. 2023)]MCT2399218.1 GDSL-type esterase/lipase family protein [Novosphingobium mangrovi (ex Huang et al. 2023)]
MAVRRRVVLTGLALALAVYIGILFWNDHRRAGLVGLNDRPCTAEGRSVTGSDFDDWAALCAWREENRRLAAAGTRPDVVMIGDSLTGRWPDSAPGIVKRGAGGQTSAQVLLRFRQDALSLRPRIVHILVGSNDLIGLGGPFTLEEFEGNVLDMAELAKFHGETVILGTIPPMRDYAGFKPSDPAPALSRLNTALRTLAADHGLILADYHAALVRPDGTMRKDLFLGDGIHLTPEGYEIVQAVFDKALSEARNKAPQE